MIKLLIADDEVIVQEGLSTVFDWASMGVELIGTASDGREAYDMCVKNRPDLLISDICMPQMDCFELANALSECGLNPKIIIISGVQDFQYAKSALKLKAYAYILKPVDIDELEQTVRSALADIRAEQTDHDTLTKAQSVLQENRQILTDEFVRSWLTGAQKGARDLEGHIRRLGLSIPLDQWLRAAVIRPRVHPDAVLDRLRRELAAQGAVGVCTCFHDGLIALITSLSAEDTCRLLHQALHGEGEGGVGRSVVAVEDIPNSFMQANRALEFTFFTGKGTVNRYSDVRNRIRVENSQMIRKEDELLKSITSGNAELAESQALNLLNAFEDSSEHSPERARLYAMRLLFMIEKIGVKLDNDYVSDSWYRRMMDRLLQCSEMNEMHALVLEVALRVTEYYAQSIAASRMTLSERVKQYIDKNFARPIDIASIASAMHFSRSHISSCFHNDTGISINDYITNTRMEHAKTLLLTTDMKILDISAACGYQDANYFSRVFKRTQGIYPMQYREQMKI